MFWNWISKSNQQWKTVYDENIRSVEKKILPKIILSFKGNILRQWKIWSKQILNVFSIVTTTINRIQVGTYVQINSFFFKFNENMPCCGVHTKLMFTQKIWNCTYTYVVTNVQMCLHIIFYSIFTSQNGWN